MTWTAPYGFCKSEDATPAVKARMAAEAPMCFENLLNLYSKLEELDDDRAMVDLLCRWV